MESLTIAYDVVAEAVWSLVSGDLLLLAIWILGLVFAWSGSIKLRFPDLAGLALVDLGVVRKVRRKSGTAAGVIECTVAVALLAFGTASAVPLLMATGLLALFMFLLV